MMKRSGKISGRAKGFGIAAAVMVLILAVGFASAKVYVSSHFVRGTIINGIDVSGKKIDSLKKIIAGYQLQVTEREGEGKEGEQETFTEFISGNEINLQLGSEDPLHDIIEEQSVWSAITGAEQGFEISGCLTYDEDALVKQVQALKCLDETYVTEPTDAQPKGYDKSTGKFEVEEEKPGNILDEKASIKAVKQAVDNLSQHVDLAEQDCYVKPEITKESKEITKILDVLNKYVSTEITYDFGDEKEVLNGEQIHEWLDTDAKGKVQIDKKKISKYVADLRQKYDTIFRDREFKTAYGTVVKVKGGDYGWWMNYKQEEKKILKLIKKGKKISRIPVYYQKAAAFGKQDYGDTYVEVDLTKQHVFLIKKGKVVLEADCVTGNTSRGNGTPEGTYEITYKQRNATLNGEGYSTPVDYWMPFNGNVGLHDANWRSSFGGTIYKYNGSHGCVNMPPSAAEKLYSIVDKGTPVICYYSDHIIKEKSADAEASPKVTSKASPKVTPKATAKVTPKASPKVTPKASPKVTKKPKETKKPKQTKKPKKTKKPKQTKKTNQTKATEKPIVKTTPEVEEVIKTQETQKPAEVPKETTAPDDSATE